MTPTICDTYAHTPAAIVINVTRDDTIQGKPWVYTVASHTGKVTIDKLDLDFTGENRPVEVTFDLKSPGYIFFKKDKKNVIGFADADDQSAVQPVGPGHDQVHNVQRVSKTEVTFCYMNKHKAAWSRYSIYLGDPKSDIEFGPIDPRIGNGSFVPPP